MRGLLVACVAAACSHSPRTPAGAAGAPAGQEREKSELAALGYTPVEPDASATVSGRVLDPEGRPLAEFGVRTLWVDPHGWYEQAGPVTAVRGAADGGFSTRVPPGKCLIEAHAAGFAPSFSAPIEVESGSAIADVVLRLSRGGTLVGRVVDGHGADPVPGAEVVPFDGAEILWPSDFPERPQGRTGADGRFTIEHVPAGDCSLRVHMAGYAGLVVPEVHVEEGKTSELPLLVLVRGATVTGVVRGSGDTLVAGASVQITPTDGVRDNAP